MDAYDFQIWSQEVGVPEVECVIEFTDAHRLKLSGEKKHSDDGRLLIWGTEACFQDATGRWWFVAAYDHYHANHPKGNRDLIKGSKIK